MWERGSWCTPGGAVEPGENKLQALEREMREEVSLRLDLTSEELPPHYLGGWQQSRARDNLINDNFSAFVVKCASDDFEVDRSEVNHAAWFDWKVLLEAWRDAGRPLTDGDGKALKQFQMDGCDGWQPQPEGRNAVRLNVLEWLDRWQDGRAIPCAYSEQMQAGEKAAKVKIG